MKGERVVDGWKPACWGRRFPHASNGAPLGNPLTVTTPTTSSKVLHNNEQAYKVNK